MFISWLEAMRKEGREGEEEEGEEDPTVSLPSCFDPNNSPTPFDPQDVSTTKYTRQLPQSLGSL